VPAGRITVARLSAADDPEICTSKAHPKLAERMSEGIENALASRSSVVGVAMADTSEGITCQMHQWWHFDAASVVKVIILGALLHELMTEHRDLSARQVILTREMITESSNSAATALWDEVGMTNLRHFLYRAKMTHTKLNQAWGLTQINAHDELLLLRLLITKNTVLDKPSRAYALRLMAQVIAAQRWGVPYGAPSDVRVHVKNGWLPLPTGGWRINSIGDFTGHHRDYSIAILTKDNPSMEYGIVTIQAAAQVINRDLSERRG